MCGFGGAQASQQTSFAFLFCITITEVPFPPFPSVTQRDAANAPSMRANAVWLPRTSPSSASSTWATRTHTRVRVARSLSGCLAKLCNCRAINYCIIVGPTTRSIIKKKSSCQSHLILITETERRDHDQKYRGMVAIKFV